MTKTVISPNTRNSSRRRPLERGDSVKTTATNMFGSGCSVASKRRRTTPSPSHSSRKRPTGRGDKSRSASTRSSLRLDSSSKKRSLRSSTGGLSRESSKTGSATSISRKRKERPNRNCSGSGKKHIEDRFFKDLEDAQNKQKTKKDKKALKNKKALNDVRSNGIKYKCDGLVKFSSKSGYKVSATFLPTWTRGKPHVVLSKNWKKEDKPLKPNRKKEYVKGYEDVQNFCEVVEDTEQSEEEGRSQKRPKKMDLIGSPNLAKPMASAAGKGPKKKVHRCTICNAGYHEDSKKMWMFCGGVGGKKCNKLAVHAACHFVYCEDQDELDNMWKEWIRCHDCRQILISMKKKSTGKKMAKKTVTKKKPKKSSTRKDSLDDGARPGPSKGRGAKKDNTRKNDTDTKAKTSRSRILSSSSSNDFTK